jgi:hypothetical protein
MVHINKKNFVKGVSAKEEFYDSKMYLFLMCEQREIYNLKWIESEKVNRDIGIDKAVFLWTTKYRSGWVTQYKELSTF